MMDHSKLEMLTTYMKANVAPILVENISKDVFVEQAVIIEATIDKSLLNGHYEGIEYLPPEWFSKLKEKKLLVINQLSSIPKSDQKKFIELLKYKKISTFELPENCVIVITCEDSRMINEEIYSLVAHIGEQNGN